MKTIKFLSLAALALTFAACSNDNDNALVQQPALQVAKGKVTITAQLAPKGAATRAVSEGTGDDEGNIVASWAVDEHLAILYIKDETNYEADATITAVDGTTGVATITFTVVEGTLDDTACTIVYPKSAAKDDHTGVKDAATLLGAQDGTLNDDLDVRVGAGTIKVTTPSLSVTTEPEAQFTIFKFTVKNSDASATINVNSLTAVIGNQQYVITPAPATSVLYAALPAVSNKTVVFSAAGNDNKNYFFSKDGVTFEPKRYYQSSLKMTQGAHLAALTANYTAQDGDVLTGTLGANVKISIADGAAVTLDGVSINANGTWESGDYAGLTPLGDATITLKEGTTNTVKGFNQDYPGIYAAKDKTLIINGEGSLNVSSNGMAAGIGSGWWVESGDIEIQSGTIVAEGGSLGSGIGGAGSNNGHCGNITILGGNIQATGGNAAAGIGAACGNGGDITIGGGSITAEGGGAGAGIGCGGGTIGSITITAGLINATGGLGAAGIGPGSGGDCSKITIQGGTVNATGGDYYPDGDGAGAGIGTGADYSTCNNITITGGTIEAIGGKDDESGEGKTGAGIGTGTSSSCEGISITAQVIQVTATKGGDGSESIGAGKDGYLYNDVSIEAGANVIQN